MNDSLGKAAVRIAFRYLRRRYRREIRIGFSISAVGLAIAVYLASRDVREG
jgi:ABC-type lipoprotein release transport system permease subunit